MPKSLVGEGLILGSDILIPSKVGNMHLDFRNILLKYARDKRRDKFVINRIIVVQQVKEKIKAVSFSLFFYYNLANNLIEEVRWTHDIVPLVCLKYSRFDFHEGNLNGHVISCIWSFCSFRHKLLDRNLLSPKLKVPPTIMYANNFGIAIYSH